jgi:EamA-like transporter family
MMIRSAPRPVRTPSTDVAIRTPCAVVVNSLAANLVSCSVATSFSYVNPVVALFLGWLLFEEPLGVAMLLAGAVIVTGVCLIVSTRGQAPCSPHHPLTSGQGHLYVVRGAGRPALVVETPEVLARLDQT